jgi:hypothetical protein
LKPDKGKGSYPGKKKISERERLLLNLRDFRKFQKKIQLWEKVTEKPEEERSYLVPLE